MKPSFYLTRFVMISVIALLCVSTLQAQNKKPVLQPSMDLTNVDLDNILYSGYENKFTVSVPGVADNLVSVESDDATLKKQGPFWFIIPNEEVKTVRVNVYATINGEKKLMGNKAFRVLATPKPSAYLSVKGRLYASGSIPRSALIDESGELVISYGPGCPLLAVGTISSFKTNIRGTQTEVQGNKFTEAQLEQIRPLKKGDRVTITDLRVRTTNNAQLYVPALVLTLQ